MEVEVFGSTDPVAAANALSSLTLAATGTSVREGLWYQSSVAAVAGVVLEDGREVVVRAYQRSVRRSFLEGEVRVQSRLAQHGFPSASPLGGPVVSDGVLGRVESLLVDPGARPLGQGAMGVSASGLAELAKFTSGIDPAGLDANPMALIDSALYPPPHSPLFDFDATAAGAQWIDEIASAARAAMTADHAIISHSDWSARNVRIGRDGLVCVYDWESLQYGPESISVGVAAATWRSLGELNDPMAPSAAEIERYIDLYEAARGTAFSPNERRSTLAAAVFALAYTARCEHALQPGVRNGRASSRLVTDNGLRSLLS